MKIRNLLVVILWMVFTLLLTAGLTMAAETELPRSGQTGCWDGTGASIPCAGTGQDGDLQAGAEWPSPRFTNNGDGTITDNLTGLVWLQNANCFGAQSWQNALNSSNALMDDGVQCGLSDGSVVGDWRLPNINELASLYNAQPSNAATWLASQGFSGVQSYNYWSSTSRASSTNEAFFVIMDEGIIDSLSKVASYYCWPVRTGGGSPPSEPVKTGQNACWNASGTSIPCAGTGQDGDYQAGMAWPVPRFTNNGDGTITDNLTGLFWLQNAGCMGSQTWEGALIAVNSLMSGAAPCWISDGSVAGDWRLPNIKEVTSLTDYSQYDPPFPVGHPFTNWQYGYYRASSTFAAQTDTAWVLFSYGGHLLNDNKSYSTNRFTWAVRDIFRYTLTVSISGTGSGSVVSSPEGIDCGGACAVDFDDNTLVVLTPSPDAGSYFAGWSGDCDVDGSVIMDMAKSCTATFSPIPPEVSDDSGHVLEAVRNGTNPDHVDFLFEDVGGVNYDLYVSTSPGTHPFAVASIDFGKLVCGIPIDNDLGDMLEVLDYPVASGITGDTTALFFLISTDMGVTGSEGTLGTDSDSVGRTADAGCQ